MNPVPSTTGPVPYDAVLSAESRNTSPSPFVALIEIVDVVHSTAIAHHEPCAHVASVSVARDVVEVIEHFVPSVVTIVLRS